MNRKKKAFTMFRKVPWGSRPKTKPQREESTYNEVERKEEFKASQGKVAQKRR